jgi:acetoin utilization deacetylase AcuC-like enzyme
VKILWSSQHLLHNPTYEFLDGRLQPYLESPNRVEIIQAALQHEHDWLEPEVLPALSDVVHSVHDAGYLEWLGTGYARWRAVNPAEGDVLPTTFPVRGLSGFDASRSSHPYVLAGYYATDTSATLTATTHTAAWASANLALVGGTLLKTERFVYALCRPPGHHAMRGAMGGYCFINNAAVAAQQLARQGARVAVLDVDYHHGNGTQDIFHDRNDVLTVSIHADPSFEYPYYFGYHDEIGTGDGAGYNLNIPLPAGTMIKTYLSALEVACQRILEFKAETLVLSVGFDTFHEDPLGTFKLQTEDYAVIAARISKLELPTLIVQEGGYATDDLGRNARAFLRGFQ